MEILLSCSKIHPNFRQPMIEYYPTVVHRTYSLSVVVSLSDIPEVNWVIQLDCPENANTYIHRAGRTARYQKGGEALLVLVPSEEKGMIEQLEAKKIPINKIR